MFLIFQVTVEDPKTGEAVDFPCRRWFSTSEDDGKISRELVRGDGKDDEMIVDKGKSCSDMTSIMITNKGSYFPKSH